LRPRDTALALLVVLLWGVSFVVIKLGLRGVSPFVLGGLRCALAAVPAVFFVAPPRVPLRIYVAFAASTFLGQFALLFWAIHLGMPSGLASVVQPSQAFFTVALAAIVLREMPTRPQLVGMALAAFGLLLIGGGMGPSVPLAAFGLNVCAAASWAVGNLASRSLSRYGPVNAFAFVVWSGLLPPLPFFALAWLLEGHATVAASFRAMTVTSWAAAAYLGLAGTLGGYGLWNRLLKSYPAAQVTPFALLVPVIGLAAGAVVFAERFTPAQLAGSALVATGLAIPVLSGRRLARAVTGPASRP
jgi:O-acetylserine/cysteine efflux transporter